MLLLEKFLAYYCSPAMAGIKPSNLVTCFKDKLPNAKESIALLNKKLNKRDIYIDILCECPARLLLIVYRKGQLLKQLHDPAISDFLKTYGYDPNGSLKDYFRVLKARLQEDQFPHEIGAFLGYPLEDIHGFIRTKGREYLCVGDWKVYGDVEHAQRLFCQYKTCRNTILSRVKNGQSLAEIFRAA